MIALLSRDEREGRECRCLASLADNLLQKQQKQPGPTARFAVSRLGFSGEERHTTSLTVRDKVVVTGAARGIGQEFARSLAAAGAFVVAADVNDCAATLDLMEAESGKAVGVTLDVRSAGSASDMIGAATRAFG